MVDVQKAFEALQQDINLRYHDKVLLRCRDSTLHTVRKSLPEDPDLIKTELTALIGLDRHEEAMQVIPPTPAFDYERGYLLYKLGKFRDVAALCEGRPDPKFQHLCAQAHYKLGNFGRAMGMYQELSGIKGDQSSTLVNLSAAGVAPGVAETMLAHAQLNAALEWEVLYNKSLALALERKYAEALNLLSQAGRTLSKEEDVEEELLQIDLQRAYILQKMEETQQAQQLYTHIQEAQSHDTNVQAVAAHNLAMAQEQAQTFTEALKGENKLTILQQAAALMNLALVYAKKRKNAEFEDCLKQVEDLGLGERLLILRAWNFMKEKKHAEYERLLRGKGTMASLKLLSSIYIQQKKNAEAAAAYRDMVALMDQRSRSPDLFLTLAGLWDKAGNLGEAISILQTAIASFPNNKAILRRLWEGLHRNSQFTEAAHFLETYQKQFPEDLDTASLLVLAEANVDLEAAVKYSSKLPEVNLKALYNREGIIESLDEILNRLEAGGAAQVKAKAEEAKVDAVTRKKRKRKPKYPKGFDPSNPNNPLPDPERWLAKKDRSTYKKSKKSKKDAKMKGPQGEMPTVAGVEQGTFSSGPSTKHIEAVVDKSALKKKSKKKS